MIAYEDFCGRLEGLREQVKTACGQASRRLAEVGIMAVTKRHPLEALQYAARAGLPCIGENRVQEAVSKFAMDDCPAIRKELIGHLQGNKAKQAVLAFDRIQSVDSVKLAERIDRLAGELGKVMPILLQCNVDGDVAKFGLDAEAMKPMVEAVLGLSHVRLEGLMTIGVLSTQESVVRNTFAGLREMRDTLAGEFACELKELSMGMSGDVEWAVAEGSTLIRVGTALYGQRD